MRLYELINFSPIRSSHTDFDQKNKVRNYTKSDVVGVGAFSAAYDTHSNKRLNQVTKIGKAGNFDGGGHVKSVSDISKDGFLSYIRAVHEYNERGKYNPYFPVIHNLKIRKDEADRLTYSADMERLHEYESKKIMGNYDLMISLYDRMFKKPWDPKWAFDYMPREILSQLSSGLRSNNIADPKLLDALYLIRNIIKTGLNFNLDLHSGNLMWRITGNMPQLVILDPIA